MKIQKRTYVPEYVFGAGATALGHYLWKDSRGCYYEGNTKIVAGTIFTAGLGTFTYALFDHDRTAKGKNNRP